MIYIVNDIGSNFKKAREIHWKVMKTLLDQLQAEIARIHDYVLCYISWSSHRFFFPHNEYNLQKT